MTTEGTQAGTLAITIRPDFAPTFDDMVTLEQAGTPGAIKFSALKELFDRAIEGGVGHLPVTAATMRAISAALKSHFEALANPNG
jgi:hypothetical protein